MVWCHVSHAVWLELGGLFERLPTSNSQDALGFYYEFSQGGPNSDDDF